MELNEIAEELGLTLKQVKWALCKGLRKLRDGRAEELRGAVWAKPEKEHQIIIRGGRI